MMDIKILRAAGLTEAQIMRVLEIEQQEHKLSRREQNRINKQNQRSRHQSQRVSADTHVIDDPPPTYTTPPKEKEPKRVLSIGTRIPENWSATVKEMEFGREHGLSDSVIAEEEAKFRDYWTARAGSGGRKVDWSATWRNWIRNKRSNGNGGPNGARESVEEQGKRLADEWRRRELDIAVHGKAHDAGGDRGGQ